MTPTARMARVVLLNVGKRCQCRAIAFCGVVILTMLAAAGFVPRLRGDPAGQNRDDAAEAG